MAQLDRAFGGRGIVPVGQQFKPAFFADLDAFSRIVVGGAVTSGLRRLFKHLPVDYATRER